MIGDLPTEFKETWSDKHFRIIAAFANTEGGTLYIGLDDEGNVVGVDNYKELLKKLPDKIDTIPNVQAIVKHHEKDGKVYLTITVERSENIVFLDGKVFFKSGSTTRLMKGRSLRAVALKKNYLPWTEETTPKVSISELSDFTYRDFLKKALSLGMLKKEDCNLTIEELFDKLHLCTDDELKMGTILLFHPNPQKFTPGAFVQIGMFDGSKILYQDQLEGPLFTMPDRVVDILLTKYMISPISFDGIYRKEPKPYPLSSIREAVLNMIMHSDYGDMVSMQIKVFADRLELWNSGSPPYDWTLETLVTSHRSVPGNPTIATVFHRAGMVEKFGRGIKTILDGFEGSGVRKPDFDFSLTEFHVTFYREMVAEDELASNEDSEMKMVNEDFSNTEMLLIAMISESRFTNSENAALEIDVNKKTIERCLRQLKAKGVIEHKGSRRSGKWIVKNSE